MTFKLFQITIIIDRIIIDRIISDNYNIMKYMEIILEHGSTEDDGLNLDISQKKHVKPSDNQEEENSFNSSNFSKKITTKTINIEIKKICKKILIMKSLNCPAEATIRK